MWSHKLRHYTTLSKFDSLPTWQLLLAKHKKMTHKVQTRCKKRGWLIGVPLTALVSFADAKSGCEGGWLPSSLNSTVPGQCFVCHRFPACLPLGGLAGSFAFISSCLIVGSKKLESKDREGRRGHHTNKTGWPRKVEKRASLISVDHF